MTDARSIIDRLRHGDEPTPAEFDWFAKGLADGFVSDAQAGAFAMGICVRGLTRDGRTALTLAMRNSGQLLSWDNVEAPVIDKHSSGGVGDCVSMVLIPALAACGGYVPKISGRGLGHTGGTLDKLESIPGVTTQVSVETLRKILAEAGCAIVGATSEIAPADKRLYAVRDVTATVESLDLITASILSKKLAANPDALVLDVKVGSGALIKTIDDARHLAEALVETANFDEFCCKTTALITDMNQPLVPAAGNALELREVMKVLTGDVQGGPLMTIVSALGGELLVNAQLAIDVQDGMSQVVQAIQTGAAVERFEKMLAAMGGPVNFAQKWEHILPCANVVHPVTAQSDGYVQSIDGERIGLAVIDLGGGRKVESDWINCAVGISDVVRIGEKVEKGQVIAEVHAESLDVARMVEVTIGDAIRLSSDEVESPDLIYDRVY
ncbi:MAG: thymidine phosphorylase [Aestuariivita sp.]|nr:thymidine phosphorylase [Aestuariivita sp.]